MRLKQEAERKHPEFINCLTTCSVFLIKSPKISPVTGSWH